MARFAENAAHEDRAYALRADVGGQAGRERGAMVETAAAGRGQQVHDLAPGAAVLADAGPDKPLLVAHSFRRRPGDGFRGRFDLAMVAGRFRGGRQAILAADRSVVSAKRSNAGGNRLDSDGAAAVCAVAAGGSFSRAPRRRPAIRSPTPDFQGRDRSAGRRRASRCRWCVRASRWPARSTTRSGRAITP